MFLTLNTAVAKYLLSKELRKNKKAIAWLTDTRRIHSSEERIGDNYSFFWSVGSKRRNNVDLVLNSLTRKCLLSHEEVSDRLM